MARANSGNFRGPKARLAFSDSLFEARAFEGGKLKFGCTLIYDAADILKPVPGDQRGRSIIDILNEVGRKEWGPPYENLRGPMKGPLLTPASRIKWPILDGDGPQARARETNELHNGFGPGKVFIRASTSDDTMPVQLRFRDKYTQSTKADFYSGCYVSPVINIYAWRHPASGFGMSFGVSMLQKTGEGESLGGRAPINVDNWYLEDAYEDEDEDGASTGTGGSVYD